MRAGSPAFRVELTAEIAKNSVRKNAVKKPNPTISANPAVSHLA